MTWCFTLIRLGIEVINMTTWCAIEPDVETIKSQPSSLITTYKGRIACSQPACLLKKQVSGARQLADITVQMLAGEPVSKFVSSSARILARPQCKSCALRIMEGKKAFRNVEEWKQLDDLGQWHNRRQRRRRNRLAYAGR
jgi:hypothetical protein